MGLTTEFLEKEQITQVETENSEIFELKDCIGEGGQGAVFKTQRKNLLVKLSISRDNSLNKIKSIYRRYNNLRCRRDFPAYLAKPLCEIAPIERNDHIIYGYVMELMEDMVSINSLFRKNNENPLEYINRMGGIQRMYTILRKTAEILDKIHSLGYCYGDLNPNNVFVSSDTNYNEVQLIDCDNLMIASEFEGMIYYPNYGAPEVVKGLSSNNAITDTWSFAVLAFYTLRQVFPFNGLLVTEANSLNLSQMEAKAKFAELPFIDDEQGDNNPPSTAYPIDTMETSELKELFKQTFEKKQSPMERPALFEWIEALQHGENSFVICASCGAHYLKRKAIKNCPFCDSTSLKAYVIAQAYVQHGNYVELCGKQTIITQNNSAIIEIPFKEYQMLKVEMSYNNTDNKIIIKQLTSEKIPTKWAIERITAKAKTAILPPEMPIRFSAQDGIDNYLIFPSYTFKIDNNEEELHKATGIIRFKYRGANG